MGTRSLLVRKSRNVGGTSYIAKASVTVTFAESSTNTNVTVTAQKVTVSAVSYAGGTTTQYRNLVKDELVSALNNTTVSLTVTGTSLFSKTGLALGGTYTVSGSKPINKTKSATTASLVWTVSSSTDSPSSFTIDIPALPSYPVTYYGRSGSNTPAAQTKWFNEALPLRSEIPSKTGYTFKGWATSEDNAKAGSPNTDYDPGKTYAAGTNQKLDLYAVWELTYQKPSIQLASLHADRCNSTGEPEDDGGYALVTFDWNVFKTDATRYYEGNTNNRPYQNNGVQNCTVTINGETVSATLTSTSATAVLGGSYNPDSSYDVSISLTDTQILVSDHTITATTILPTAKFPIDINADATAIAFLSTAPENKEGVFCPDMTSSEIQDFVDDLQVVGNGIVVDYIVDQGTSGIWTYRKWASGIAECWGVTESKSHAMTQQSGNGYWVAEGYSLPSGLFTSIRSAQANRSTGQGLVFISIYGATAASIQCYVSCTTSLTQTFSIYFDVKGRWK